MNKPQILELLFDNPIVGQNKFGNYFLYAVKNSDGEELSYFATPDVNDILKTFKKGDKFEITKLAEQKGSKIITKFDIKPLTSTTPQQPTTNYQQPTNNNPPPTNFYDTMLNCYKDALKIQEQLNGMVDVNRIAITLFIARSKIPQNGFAG